MPDVEVLAYKVLVVAVWIVIISVSAGLIFRGKRK
jgi:hypothetical protein